MNSDTLIIIIIFSSLGLLAFVFALSKLYRSVSTTSNPLPPVQPLAHHRHTLYQLHQFQSNSKSSLLEDEYILVDPQPLFHNEQPRPSSSLSTTNASTPPSSVRKLRPTSIASSSRLSPSPSFNLPSGRRGPPHNSHSQINIVLPAPLSACPSNSSIVPTSEFGHVNLSATPRRPASSPRPTSRHFLDVSSASLEHRRSMSFVDRWLPTPSTDSYSLNMNYDSSALTQPRVPSPLIPLSPSTSSLIQAQAQKRKSIATNLRNPSPSSSNFNSGMESGTNPTTSSQSISLDTIPNPNPSPILMPVPTAVTATTGDIPQIPTDNIPSPLPSSSNSDTDHHGDNNPSPSPRPI